MVVEKIKSLLESRRMTQKELAKRLGITASALSQTLNGNDLKVSTLQKIANALGVPVSFFFEEPSSAHIINNGGIQAVGSENKIIMENEHLHRELAECQKKLTEIQEKYIKLLEKQQNKKKYE